MRNAPTATLGEYYSERDTRTPVWVCAGDVVSAAQLAGLSDAPRAGGEANPEAVPTNASVRRQTRRHHSDVGQRADVSAYGQPRRLGVGAGRVRYGASRGTGDVSRR
jgi:hypothetical protein